MPQKILVLDTETTGFGHAGICELAWVEVDHDLNVIAEFEQRINPEMPISAGASAVHGIVDADVVGCPTIHEVMAALDYPMADKPLIIGHNIDFDLKMLREYGEGLPSLCTLGIARRVWPELDNHKLGTLMYALKLPILDQHAALTDVFTCLGVLRLAMEKLGKTLPEMVEFSREALIPQIMTFGKHKGTPIKALPRDYVKWLRGLDNLDPNLALALNRAFPS